MKQLPDYVRGALAQARNAIAKARETKDKPRRAASYVPEDK